MPPAPHEAAFALFALLVLGSTSVLGLDEATAMRSPPPRTIRLDALENQGPAPDFHAVDLTGEAHRFHAWRGDEPAAIIFFDEHCDHCAPDIAGIAPLRLRLELWQVRTAVVASTGTRLNTEKVAKSAGLKAPVFLDRSGSVTDRYRVGHVTWVLIDASGIVRFKGPMPTLEDLPSILDPTRKP